VFYTADDIQNLKLDTHKPLIISDADEVIVHFAAPFKEYIKQRNLYVDFKSYALWGNVRHQHNNEPIDRQQIKPLVDDFLDHITDQQPLVEGAVANLCQLAQTAQVLILTNINTHQAQKRKKHLHNNGLEFPLISNSGPKGPIVNYLQSQIKEPVIFIDDIDKHITSVAQYVPHSLRLHFIASAELSQIEKQAAHSHIRCQNWDEIHNAIEQYWQGQHPPSPPATLIKN
tara:strand:- start:1129 stop:1815 length:687 start_codon:yes stop_codon:yes gene_type:complete